MGLAEPGRPADEQRVVGQAGHLGDRERGGVREAVRVADHELVEREAGVDSPCGCVALRRCAAVGSRGSWRVSGAAGPSGSLREMSRRRSADRAPRRAQAFSSRPKRRSTRARIVVGRGEDEQVAVPCDGLERVEPELPHRLGYRRAESGADERPGVSEVVVGHGRARAPPLRGGGAKGRMKEPEGRRGANIATARRPRGPSEGVAGGTAQNARKRCAGSPEGVDSCRRRVDKGVRAAVRAGPAGSPVYPVRAGSRSPPASRSCL